MNQLKVLVVEDEDQIRDVVIQYLKAAGYEAIEARDGFQGLSKFVDTSPDLVVLDVMMPGISGFEVLKELRSTSDVPVIMLTAKQAEVDRLTGFDLGADDYVAKPFSPRELMRRINAIMKRIRKISDGSDKLRCGELTLLTATKSLLKNNVMIELTTKEYQLLHVFFENKGYLLTREQLINDAFGHEYAGFDRSIDTHIKKIRQKIEEDSRKPKYLKTKYGAGYMFGGDGCDR